MRKLMAAMLVLAAMTMATASEPIITVNSRVVSDYCWSLGGHTNHPAWQGWATVAWPSAKVTPYAGVWWSAGGGTYGKEIDYYAGLTGPIGRGVWDVSVLFYDMDAVWTWGPADMLEATVSYKQPVSSRWTVGGVLRWLQPTGSGMPKGAPMLYGEANYRLPLSERWAFTTGGKLGYDTGCFGGEAGLLARPEASLVWSLSPRTTIDLKTEVSLPVAGINDRTTNVIVSLGVQQTF